MASTTYSVVEILSLTMISFLLLIGIPGNIMVIYVFGYRRKSTRTRFELLLLILGVIDLISITVVPITFLYLTATRFQAWHFGYTACKVIPSLLQISITISQSVLLLICYERYCAVVYPFEYRYLSRMKIVSYLILSVLLSVAFAYPYQHTFDIQAIKKYSIKTCAPNLEERIDYLLLSSALQIVRDLASVFILATLSYRMNKSLRQHVELATRDGSNILRSCKLLKTVVVVFTILCLPVDIFHLIYYIMSKTAGYFSSETYEVIETVNTLLNLLQISNAVVNVFIYSKMHVFFRNTIFRHSMKEYMENVSRLPSRTVTSLLSFAHQQQFV